MDQVGIAEREKEYLTLLAKWEDIVGKRLKIYSRLLTDPALAKTMEQYALRHEKRKEALLALAVEKLTKKKGGEEI